MDIRLSERLHERIESITLDALPRLLSSLRGYGGYFRRFRIPAILRDHVNDNGELLPNVSSSDLSLDQRLTLAFLEADVECLDLLRDDGPEGYHEGSTGSVAIIEPRDDKAFWESQQYDVVVGHVGDTR